MPDNRRPTLPAPALIPARAPIAPAAVKVAQGKLVPMPGTPCGCGPKTPPIQMASKKQKKLAGLYDQAAQNWENYACYDSSYARTIERFFLDFTPAKKVRTAIISYMVARGLGGQDSYPGHCSADSSHKQNSGTKAVVDKIHAAFEKYMAKMEK